MTTGVSIIGVGMTKFGEHWTQGLRDLMVEAGVKAIMDAKIDGPDIDAVYGGCMSAGRLTGQEHIGALIADQSGLNPIPATRVEAACSSGGLALKQGIMSIQSGENEIVIVGGVEKMSDVDVSQVTTTLASAADRVWEGGFGATFPALYALIARRHMHELGTTEEQMAMVAVKNHKNAVHNPYAQYQYEVTLEDVMKSAPVAEPLKLLDCSPITDGAAAVIIAKDSIARKYTDTPIRILASTQASDTLSLHDRASLTRLDATMHAVKEAYERTKLKPGDIDVCEVHDCFTIAEILAIEDLGFFKKGDGGRATEEGETQRGAKISINTSGGLKACGHPVGATGVKQAVEIAWQLRGEAGKRQVECEKGMAHNIGGSGATCLVHIFSR
ncbi:MAG: thiolase domain-containing protein [Candidatus Altiarchaeota archaeon]|nr:thiolase domain-containing protein [Candidatus Altiarchaeota archaeon]